MKDTYQSLRQRLRDIVARALGTRPRKPNLEDFTFIGAGQSEQRHLSPVSERHDAALADAWRDEHDAGS